MTPGEIAGALQELFPVLRNEILEVVDCVDEVVPLLPEVELASTIVATGLADAGWLVEFATAEQRAACLDLDCWNDARFSPSRLMEWIDALIEAGPETLAAAFDELDLDLWILALKTMADFKLAGAGDAVGASTSDYDTQDGVVYFAAHSSSHEERLHTILDTARFYSPRHYWVFVFAAINDSREECEQIAARLHAGRLNDLGFPGREHAMRAYRPLPVDSVPTVDVDTRTTRGHGLVAAPQLPQRLAGTLVGRALAELPADRATEVLGYVLAVANALAVADELPLAEPESIRESLAKAIRGIDRGLAELARSRDQSLARVLDATRPLDLFRVGATLDPSLRPVKSLADLDEAESRDFGKSAADDLRGAQLDRDWNLELEEVAEEDKTLRRNERPR